MSFLKIDFKDTFTTALMAKLKQAGPRAAHAVAVQIQKDTEPFVPALTKSLVNRTQVIGSQIVYPGPSARMLHEGKLMIDPNTGSAWARKGATKVVTGKDLKFNHSAHSQAQAHWEQASKAQNINKWLLTADMAVRRELKK